MVLSNDLQIYFAYLRHLYASGDDVAAAVAAAAAAAHAVAETEDSQRFASGEHRDTHLDERSGQRRQSLMPTIRCEILFGEPVYRCEPVYKDYIKKITLNTPVHG